MKKDIHPENYRYVVFQDLSCDYSFLTRSTVETKEKIKWEDCKETGYHKEVPQWLSLWLLVACDNTIHLLINYLALEYL